MKKQILLPVLLAVIAVGSAFASISFAPGYYPVNDTTCSSTPSSTPQCTIGDDELCTDGAEQPYYTKPNSALPTNEITNPCTVFEREVL